jgi:hypothetical protein
MKNFKLIAKDLDVAKVAAELKSTDLWTDMDGTYLKHGKSAGSRVIRLRGVAPAEGRYYGDVLDSVYLDAWDKLPETRGVLLNFLERTGGELGRVRVAMIDSRAEIVPHIDVGEYFVTHDRYHIVIESPQGTRFSCGDETVVMRENELWWLDNSIMHGVENLGDSPRIHLVFDIRPPSRCASVAGGSGSS